MRFVKMWKLIIFVISIFIEIIVNYYVKILFKSEIKWSVLKVYFWYFLFDFVCIIKVLFCMCIYWVIDNLV